MIFKLNNGLRIAISQHSGNVTYCGILINAGTRDEPDNLPGLAHFVEHTIFKGTGKRSSWHISNRMESIGGELNAYTFKEGTSIYTAAPAGYEERAIELIYDLISSATFPTHEIDKEREVIIEEINSYLDNPADSIFDQFEDHIYAGSALAHNILGSPESVHKITSRDCIDFMDRLYNPANMAGFIATPADPSKIKKLLEKHWGRFNRPAQVPTRIGPKAIPTFDIIKKENGHQAHTIIGTRMFSRSDPRRFPLMLLNNYIAGPCMNSRLNQQLRERRGLVYAVDSFVSLLSDTGVFGIYFGTDHKSVDKCLKIIRHELDSLAQKSISPRQLDRIKDQYCGQLLISSDNRESMAMSLGKNLMFYSKLTDIPALAARLREVTADELRDVAELMVPSLMSRITLM